MKRPSSLRLLLAAVLGLALGFLVASLAVPQVKFLWLSFQHAGF